MKDRRCKWLFKKERVKLEKKKKKLKDLESEYLPCSVKKRGTILSPLEESCRAKLQLLQKAMHIFYIVFKLPNYLMLSGSQRRLKP